MAQRIYTVQPGDYLRKVARDHLGDESRWSEIAYINELTQPYLIRTGQVILLPDNGEALQVVVREGAGLPVPGSGGAQKEAALSLTPVTVAVVLAVAVVFLLVMDEK